MSGLISKVMTDGSTQLVGQVPGSKFSTLSISVHNLNAVDQEVVLYLTTDVTPKPVDTEEPGAILPAKGSARSTSRAKKLAPMGDTASLKS